MRNWGDIRSEAISKGGVVKEDVDRGLLLVWYGSGHGLHVYNQSGEEIAFENIGSFRKNDADRSEILERMDELVRLGNYNWC